MATKKRRSYGGTQRHHGDDARYHAKQLRAGIRHLRAHIKAGRCEQAAKGIAYVSMKEGQYADARYYSVEKPFQKRYTTYKPVESLLRRFIEKCVR